MKLHLSFNNYDYISITLQQTKHINYVSLIDMGTLYFVK